MILDSPGCILKDTPGFGPKSTYRRTKNKRVLFVSLTVNLSDLAYGSSTIQIFIRGGICLKNLESAFFRQKPREAPFLDHLKMRVKNGGSGGFSQKKAFSKFFRHIPPLIKICITTRSVR